MPAIAGVYQIVSRMTAKVLDVPGGDPADGVQIQQFTDNGGTNQQWTLVPVGDGSFKIVSAATGKVLDVPGGTTDDGALIQQFADNGGANQHWYFVPIGSSYKIVCQSSHKVLDVPGGASNDGAKVQQYSDNGGPNQHWLLMPVDAVFKIVSKGSGKVLDVPGGATEDGVKIQQFTDNGGSNQRWRIVLMSRGIYEIFSEASEKALDIPGGAPDNGVLIQQFTPNGGTNQRWFLVPFGDGCFLIFSWATKKVLDVPGGALDDGVLIQQFTSNGGTNQQWELVPVALPVPPQFVGRAFFRDHMILSSDFVSSIASKLGNDQVPKGSTVALCAKTITLGVDAQGKGIELALPDYDLVLLADNVEQGSGDINTGGLDGAPGLPGNYASDGESGAPGADGRNLTIFVKTIGDLKVTTSGGNGGRGGQGGQGSHGEPGDPGQPGDPQTGQGYIPPTPGTDGGTGGSGGPGGRGGYAGQIRVYYVTPELGVHVRSYQSQAGLGGPGGSGGPGGLGGLEANNGQPGPIGTDGTPGESSSPLIKQLDEAMFYDRLGTDFPLVVSEWVAYRLEVGLYYFRAWRPNNPDVSTFLDLALQEFNAVLALQPNNNLASLYKNWLINNRNVFGLSRDLDVIPNFDQYQSIVENNSGSVLNLFEFASSLAVNTLTLDQIRQNLTNQIASLNDFTNVLNAELAAANADLQAAGAEKAREDSLVSEIQNQIAQLTASQQAQQVLIPGEILIGVGITAAVVLGLLSAGTSLIAAVPAIIALTTPGATTLSNLVKDKDARENLREAGGDLKDLVEGLQDTYNVYKFFSDLNGASGDPQLIELLKNEVQEVYSQLLARLHGQQAQAAFQAAQAKIVQNQNEILREQAQLDGLSVTIDYLQQVAMSLIQAAQIYIDILIKYSFYAARALEIYALVDLSSQTRYDYGFIHPDKDQDLPLAQLIGEYSSSWSQFLGVVSLRDQYEQYFISGNVAQDTAFVAISDAASLAKFIANPDLLFSVQLAALPANRYEAKVISVSLSLVGARSTNPAISVIVEHTGQYSEKRRDGTQIDLILRPRPAIVQASMTSGGASGTITGGPQDLGFWGRGVAATWHLYIEADEIKLANVDLSGLTSIQIGIGYQSFIL